MHGDLLNLTYYRGRVAQHAILKGLGIGRGDEVLTQAFTCVAVPEGILATGAKPVYVDLEENGYNLDPADLEAKITPKTRAIIVQHTFGLPADMQRIMQIADAAGLPVIEDCCHTLETKINGQKVGTFGTAAFYSYEWGKPIVVGIGGSARVNTPELLEKLQAGLSEYKAPGFVGKLKLAVQYQVHNILYRPQLYWPLKKTFHQLSKLGVAKGNYNPVSVDNEDSAEDFRLAMGEAQKQKLKAKLEAEVEEYTSHSSRIVNALQTGLSENSHLQLPEFTEQTEPVLARFPLRVRDKEALVAQAKEQSVELAEWYSTPVHPIPPSQGKLIAFDGESCPLAEQRTHEIVSLPLHRRVSDRYVDQVINFLNKVA